ncbi:MAG: hypothetical protein Q8Q52_03600 [Acidimicrobiia bacterium]|nr:hypothetical protein [Acidimicrobiia bacterium]
MCVLMVGALSTELWRTIGERQELTAIADAAAIAAAGAIDLEAYRSSGEIRLDPDETVSRALAVIAGHSGGDDFAAPPVVLVAADGLSVRVDLVREVPYGLIRILALEGDRFTVTASAVAYPSVP